MKLRLKETMTTQTPKTKTARIPIQCMRTSTGSKIGGKTEDPDLAGEDLGPEETEDLEKEEPDQEITEVTADLKKET